MLSLIKKRQSDLNALCKKRFVKRLSIFGSALDNRFDPKSSDLDLLVEFKSLTPIDHADHYFGFQEDLQALFNIPVDLIEPSAIENPIFRQELEETKALLYESDRD